MPKIPKRRRLLTPLKSKSKPSIVVNTSLNKNETADKEVTAARGRLKGALLEVFDPAGEDSDSSIEHSPVKRNRYQSQESKRETDEDEITPRRKSPPRQSYVLKLFDRSVDLSQFDESSPLYPICRAWMINQPKANYREYGEKYEPHEVTEDSIELPEPDGPVVSRIPELLPEQKACSKDNINLNYREAPPPSREQLLRSHSARWGGVRRAWQEQAHRVEARYQLTQDLLNKMNVNA